MNSNTSKPYGVTLGVGQLVMILISLANNLAYEVSSDNIFLDCGSSEEQRLSYDGRNWSSDIGSHFTASNSDSNSSAVSGASKGAAVPGVPYMTARLFYSQFSYTFNVTPGQKFIRLHFYSDSYAGLNASESFLTVTAAHHYTLLRNFSCYLTAKYLKVDYFFKEFIVHVENNSLELTFWPSSDDPGAYGFINGIEVVSMPLHLYISGDDVPLPFVGFLPNVLRLDDDSALETVYRANVGGQTISANHDTVGMFRTWNADASYIFGAAYGQIDYDNTLSIQYPKTVPAYTAPVDVYRTARSMGQYSEINRNYNLSWFFPVDTGFNYLVRLHFCEIVPGMTLENQRVFFIFINNQTAETKADVIVWSKGHGVPVYQDYVVMIPPQAAGGKKQDLWLELHPNIQAKPEYYDAILNGVEILKISNSGGNLAGLNPPSYDDGQPTSFPEPRKDQSKRGLQKQIKYSLTGAAVLFVFSLFAFLLIRIKRKSKMEKPKGTSSSHCRAFHINDIRKATNNFDESKVIGEWEFGKVYKGFITGIDTAVAVKRGNKETISEERFVEEIKLISQIRHNNLISLLGYCKEDSSDTIILVYEYTDNGSLSDHLHFVGQRKKKPLSWNQRLEICVGVARGLHYLHTCEKRPIIPCEISTSNILLDKNWRAKISCFGSTSNGSDLDFHWNKRVMSETTDVYSFGLVLLEVLSGRPVPPIDMKTETDDSDGDDDDDQESLIPSASDWLEKGDADDELVDQHLKGMMISKESVRNFVKTIRQCLAKKGVKRPSMSEVLYNLEQLQVFEDSNSDESPKAILYPQSSSDLMLGVEFSEIMMFNGR